MENQPINNAFINLSEEDELNMHEDNVSTSTSNAISSSYENLIDVVENKIPFKGKSISQWTKELVLPMIPDPLERDDLLKLNQRAVQLCEIVYTNLAIAKANYISAKASYSKKINLQKESIRDQIEADNKKKPSDAIIENRAVNICTAEASAVTMAEFFHAFWQTNVDKVSAFNARLTSLNISKHNEEKYTNTQF